MSHTLWIGAGLQLVSAAVFGYVGWRIAGRPVTGHARLASDLFAAWWYALALSTLIGASVTGAAAYGHLALEYLVATTYLNLFLICVALWGLLYYLIFLYTGRKGAIVPLTVGYIAYYILLAWFVASHHPVGVVVNVYSATIDYAVKPEGPFVNTLLVLLVAPQIIGAIAYLLLYWQVETRSQRYRILLVSWSLIIWFTTPLIAVAVDTRTISWWPIFTRAIALAAAAAILMAYAPPRRVRERFGIAGVNDPEPEWRRHA